MPKATLAPQSASGKKGRTVQQLKDKVTVTRSPQPQYQLAEALTGHPVNTPVSIQHDAPNAMPSTAAPTGDGMVTKVYKPSATPSSTPVNTPNTTPANTPLNK